MVKLIAPLMSQSASGQIGGTHVHATWKGRSYARALVTPANPRTAGQLSRRAMHRFLAQAWASIGATPQASWVDAAKQGQYSPFNAFVSMNGKRWTQFQAPSQLQTAPAALTADGSPTPTVTAGVGQLTVVATPASHTNDWGYLVYRSQTTGFTPTTTDLIAVLKLSGTSAVTFVDTQVKTGETWYYRIQDFTTDGKLGTLGTQASGTAN